MISLDEYGVALALALDQRLHQPVLFNHHKALLQLGSDDRQMQITLTQFYLHDSVDNAAETISRVWQQTLTNSQPLTWDALRDHLIPHLTAAPPHPALWVLDTLSPWIVVTVGINTPSWIRFITAADRLPWLVSDAEIANQTLSNLQRLTHDHPGVADTMPSGQSLTVFEGDLATDRAWMTVLSAPEAAVAWIAREFALVIPSCDPTGVRELLVLALTAHGEGMVMPHPLPPVVHCFVQGTLQGVMTAT